jgi:hypothetical protein
MGFLARRGHARRPPGIGLLLEAFAWLANTTPDQQANWQAMPIGLYWPDLEYFTSEWPLPPYSIGRRDCSSPAIH